MPRGWSGLSGWEGVSAGPVGLAGLEGCGGGAGRLVKSRCRGVRGDAQTAGLALGGGDKGPPLGSCVSVAVRATQGMEVLVGEPRWAAEVQEPCFGSGGGEWEATGVFSLPFSTFLSQKTSNSEAGFDSSPMSAHTTFTEIDQGFSAASWRYNSVCTVHPLEVYDLVFVCLFLVYSH